MTEQLTHNLRSDARENRDRVLDAARSLFAERGLDVTMRQIARRAGVGPATLYRRFPAKQLLVEEAFAQELQACVDILAEGCDDPNPWRGFCSMIERMSVLTVRNQGFVDAFLANGRYDGAFAEHRRRLVPMLGDLAARARAAGGLRADFVLDDFVLIQLGARGLTGLPAEERERAARRHAALVIESLRADRERGVLPTPAPLVRLVLQGCE
ncbi:TetR/AcrR family transcriptional regulator [Saccharomonospora sp. CUA-673]|uniref:TetR/AcrR family transcriptional regulator n=1 Tax=Saccharomonospora sp. CUA-673 TaxID=1904969 RepID=UPI0009F98911|nr:TetR/AcrR family transcriptional regulator [Saccharomonospora sp. CUA-673]